MMKAVFDFLRELEQHNDRDWFQQHKTQYLEVRAEFESFVEQVIHGLGQYDPEVAHVTVKEATYRIYRDIRFSPDKRPYKNFMGAYIAKEGGRKSPMAGYYFHIQPQNAFLGGGIWHPDPSLLKALRQDVFNNSEELLAILQEPELAAFFTLDEEDKLQRVPAPFPTKAPQAWLVKYRSYLLDSEVEESFF
jgi:uncharacterized protein (TIGR02453 family)